LMFSFAIVLSKPSGLNMIQGVADAAGRFHPFGIKIKQVGL